MSFLTQQNMQALRVVETSFKDLQILLKFASFQEESTIEILLVRQMLQREEVKNILKKIKQYPEDLKVKTSYGYSLGMGFFETFGDVSAYFKFALKLKETNEKAFQDIVVHRLVGVYQRLFTASHIQYYPLFENTCFNPGIFKIHFPNGKYNIGLHLDTQSVISDCSAPFRKYFSNYKPISHILSLQNAQLGGHVKVYNKEISDALALLHTVEERVAFASNKPYTLIKLQPGDIMLFKGGELYHEITKVYGFKDRISYSGLSVRHLHNDSIIDLYS